MHNPQQQQHSLIAQTHSSAPLALASSLLDMASSPTLANNEAVAARRAAGRKTIHLGFGEASFPLHPLLIEALGRAAKHTHTFTIGPAGIVLNGRPCHLFVRDAATIELMSSDPDVGVVTVTPAAFWYALAGDDPTAEDAGVIQAQALASFAAMQEIARLAGQVRLLLDEIDRQVQQSSQPPLPSYRFSSFVSQVLATLDGTEEQTLAVARILKQPPQIICEWGAQVGKTVSLLLADQENQPSSISEARQTDEQQPIASPSPDVPEEEETTGGRRDKRGFAWSKEHEHLLAEAYDASHLPSDHARIKEIAAMMSRIDCNAKARKGDSSLRSE